MAILRAAVLRSAPFVAARSTAQTGFRLQQGVSRSCMRLGQQPSTRGYASATHAAKKTSDLPWAVCAVIGTSIGTYIALTPSEDTGHDHHDDHHGKEAHDEGGDDAGQESEGGGEKEESTEDKPEDTSFEDDSSDNGSSEESKNDSEDEPKDEESDESGNKSGRSDSVSRRGVEDAGDLHKGMTKVTNDTKKREEDPHMGGTKIRIDAARQTNIGEGASSGEGDQYAQKQRGVSNTDTRHSTDPHKDTSKSSKGEGTVETAKIKGTVQVDRPQV